MPERLQNREVQAEQLYQFIQVYIAQRSMPPSQREMALAIRCSTKTLPVLLAILREQGRMKTRAHRWRQTWPREA